MKKATRRTTAPAAKPRVTATAAGRAQKITPFLWFDGQVEGAAKFYTSMP